MRVLIMCDMEGVSGIVVWEQVGGGADMFEEGRKLYTEEINAAVRGAKAAGATQIVVVDCHGAGKGWTFNSLIPEMLDPDCEWVAHHGWGRYTEMWENGCDACLLIGMHARNGTPDGVLCHTISGAQYRNLWFNDDLVGETGVNAALNGHYGVPVVLVTGDRGGLPRGKGTPRSEPPHRGGEKGPQPIQRPPDCASSCPADDRRCRQKRPEGSDRHPALCARCTDDDQDRSGQRRQARRV